MRVPVQLGVVSLAAVHSPMRLLLFAALCLFTSLARAGEPVLIAAAADLKFALDDVLAQFRRRIPSSSQR